MELRESHSSLYSMVSRFIGQIPDDIGYRGDVLTDPYEYDFPHYLKDDGYDGYMFEYDNYEYYYIFYPEKCKFLGKYDEEDIG